MRKWTWLLGLLLITFFSAASIAAEKTIVLTITQNYIGFALVALGIGLMVMEVYVGSFGMLAVGGIITFIIGSRMLLNSPDVNYHVTWLLIATISIITAFFCFIILNLAIRSHKKPVVSGKEILIGAEGTVLSVMNEQVIVQIGGEIWEAKSSYMLNEGDKVRVTHINGLRLTVERR